MRILLFADLHLDRPFRWVRPAVGNRWRRSLVETLHGITKLADDLEVDALCSGGDLYEHDLVAPGTPRELQEAFARIDHIPVLLAPGNHDWYGSQSIYARTTWSPNVHVFDQDSLGRFSLADGFNVWGGAHLKPAGTAGFLDRMAPLSDSDVNVAFFHGSLRSWFDQEEHGKEPHAAFELDQVEQVGFAHAMLGHFHTPNHTRLHTYPGNPEPLGFGETGARGAVLLEFDDDGGVTHTVHELGRTRVADIRVDVDGCVTHSELRLRVEAALNGLGGIVRVRLTGEVDEAVSVGGDVLRDLGDDLDALVIRTDEVTWSYPIESIAVESTVRGEFVREVLAGDLEEETRRRVLITGLRALDSRPDLEVV